MKKFFQPKTIAIIGASENPAKVGFALMKNLLDFKGKVIPINPKHKIMWGMWCCKSVLNYRGKIDLAVIAIPAPFVARALAECGKKKIKNVVIISAGFSEIGKIEAEKELVKISKDIRLNF